MADIHLIKSAAGLVPSDAMAAEWFAKVPLGKPVNAKVTCREHSELSGVGNMPIVRFS